ncbi:MAG: DUF4352 domain-containing protein, partial [Terriglobia bacterium]
LIDCSLTRMRVSILYCAAFIVLLSGCSEKPGRQPKIFAAGEKATADQLIFSVVDSEIRTRLGDDASPRIPQNRFVVIQIAVTNSSNGDLSIPGLTLIDDSGKSYPELADGAGVQHWLGVLRRLGTGQTERGAVLFDAPAGHYKLKLTDETSENDVSIDIPLSYAHEQMNDVSAPPSQLPADSPPAPSAAPAQPKRE